MGLAKPSLLNGIKGALYGARCPGVQTLFLRKTPHARIVTRTGRGAAWLARLLWEQEVVSSNLTAPTIFPMNPLPDIIADEAQLDDVITTPSNALCEFITQISSPLVILGAGGKMGPSLAVLAHRAAQTAGHQLEVVAVSRFSDANAKAWLEERGVRAIAADLLDNDSWVGLPDTENVINLVGQKFGTTDNPGQTWVINTLVPAAACQRFKGARIAALSTGCVYPMLPANSGGATEDTPIEPVGEYVNACLARERINAHQADLHGTPLAIIRLNYAIDLRYGVLFDIASRIHAGQPVDISMGHFNCLWQGDANDMIIRSLALCETPARPLNITGAATLSTRETAHELGRLMNREPEFAGEEAETAWLSNGARAFASLGEPSTPLETMLRWTAHWVQSGGRSLGKPTHFEIRDGKF